ncbi:hypothetical protein Baya_10232 [Bagarius yarrelli]|uniref:Uncharacterized protein n=1 Tax=Bagarius yarrelli TaxID=175774 RepID=A0A556UXW3_BAGYA|nr:hypothetical protein Baya_10232 [Bagarius yarrelli]
MRKQAVSRHWGEGASSEGTRWRYPVKAPGGGTRTQSLFASELVSSLKLKPEGIIPQHTSSEKHNPFHLLPLHRTGNGKCCTAHCGPLVAALSVTPRENLKLEQQYHGDTRAAVLRVITVAIVSQRPVGGGATVKAEGSEQDSVRQRDRENKGVELGDSRGRRLSLGQFLRF